MTRVAGRREKAARVEEPKTLDTDVKLSDLLRDVGDPATLATDVASDWAPTVSDDRAAEAEADRVADATVQRLDAREAPIEDGALTPAMQAAMHIASPDLGGLDEVTFDESARAAAEADSIDALAFTRGTDVSVARGEMTPHLAAHEATHAVQHDDGMVHAKLRGTRTALEQLGGGESTKGIRKRIGAKTNWDKIVEGVGAYESLEDAILVGGKNPDAKTLKAAKPKMAKVLKGVQRDVKQWQKANDSESESKKSEEKTKKFAETGEMPESDDRSKAERRQAVGMLAPRVNHELNLLESEDSKGWLSSLGLSPDKVGAHGKESSGQKNTVKELTYKTENGEFSGYFKEDVGFAKGLEGHEADVGIQLHDPSYGARAVAMYKLDQLFNAGVTARAEFATHVTKDGKTVLGTVLQSAGGSTGADIKIAFTKEQAKQMGPDAVALTDPVLQRSLNKLQLLDAICGQLDRHDGNYYIQTDGNGNVTGVTGIDLDMAFGKDMGDDKVKAPNWRGIPDKIDEEFGEQILKVQPKDLEDALRGLLPPAEIKATVSRFENVKAVVLRVKQSEGLVSTWDESTSIRAGVEASKVGFTSSKKSYQDNMTHGALLTTQKECTALILEALSTGHGPPPFSSALYRREMDDLPDLTHQLIAQGISKKFGEMVARVLMDDRLGDRMSELTMLFLNEMLRDDTAMAKMSVYVQEHAKCSAMDLANQMGAAGNETWLPAAKKKLGTPRQKPEEQEGRRSLIGSRGRR